MPKEAIDRLKEEVTFAGSYTESHIQKALPIIFTEVSQMKEIKEQSEIAYNLMELLFTRSYIIEYFAEGVFQNQAFKLNINTAASAAVPAAVSP